MARSALTPAAALTLRRRVGAGLGYRVLSRSSAVWPVLVPFYRGHGALTEVEVFWLAAAFAGARFCGALPALRLTERAGRRGALVGAAMATAGGAALVLLGAGLGSFLVGEALLGLAWAVRAAALPDLLAATLAGAGQAEDRAGLERRARAVETGCGVAALLLAGFLLAWSPLGPYLWLLTTTSGALACALLLDEPGAQPATLPRSGASAILRELRAAPALAWPLLAGGLGGALSWVVRLSQQVLLESFGCSAPWLGVVAAGASVLAIAAVRLGRGWLGLGPLGWLSWALAPVLGSAILPQPAVTPVLLVRGFADAARSRSVADVTARLGAPTARPALDRVAEGLAQLGAVAGIAALALLTPVLGMRAALAVIGVGAALLAGAVAWGCARLGALEAAEVSDLPARRPGAGTPQRRD